MTAATNRPRGLDLVAIAQVLEHLAGELRRRGENLDERVDDLHRQSKGASDDEAETYVNALLSPLRLARDDDRAEQTVGNEIEALLDVHDMARVLHVSVKTIRGWRAGKQIPEAITIGGSLRWRRSAVEAWLAQKGGAA